ncbi:McrC family protein [Bacillus marinisedimentorum]|uniref:McrC family protein n=1 Tax=Bacillus marinisedimentorum TaxID=1821260 RepID=UPI0007E03B06|nr:hypothetical protein [Bacillus marinisedimentorum]
MKQQIILREYSDEFHLSDYVLSPDEREYLTKISIIHESRPWERRFYFDELQNGMRIKTQSWVGVIELNDVRIVIQPKFNETFSALTDMILFAEDLPYYQMERTAGDINKTNFLEILIRLFLLETEKILKMGPVKEYVRENENLRNMRGSVVFSENLKNNFNLPNRIYCQYDELVTNIMENQVILSVLAAASRFNVSAKTQQHLNLMRAQFEMLCEEYRGVHWPTFHYNRLNKHYVNAHKIGHYLWRRSSATSFLSNEEFHYSFLIDMNELFEKFAGQFLMKYLPPEYQVIAGKRVTDAITMEGTSYRHVIPDLIVKSKHTGDKKVIDVKYKQYGSKRVETSDVFQLAFYAQYNNQQSDVNYAATILYPQYAKDKQVKDIVIDLNSNSAFAGKLNVKSLNIEEILYYDKQGNRMYLETLAESI